MAASAAHAAPAAPPAAPAPAASDRSRARDRANPAGRGRRAPAAEAVRSGADEIRRSLRAGSERQHLLRPRPCVPGPGPRRRRAGGVRRVPGQRRPRAAGHAREGDARTRDAARARGHTGGEQRSAGRRDLDRRAAARRDAAQRRAVHRRGTARGGGAQHQQWHRDHGTDRGGAARDGALDVALRRGGGAGAVTEVAAVARGRAEHGTCAGRNTGSSQQRRVARPIAFRHPGAARRPASASRFWGRRLTFGV